MNIAIYGGSFDPPQIGHQMVVSHLVLNEPDLDKILVIPCFEQRNKQLTPWIHRYEMCKEAFSWLPNVEISQVEYYLGGESLTHRTIEKLHQIYPNDKMRFVIGADLMESIKMWEGYDLIESLAPPLIVGRAGITHEGSPTPICPAVSSTMVRNALLRGEYEVAKRYIATPVMAYIQSYELYRS